MTMRHILSTSSRFLLAFLVFSRGAPAQAPGESPFPIPTGPYPTGLTEYLWIDGDRPEAFTKDPDDNRHVLVRIWYPAAAARDVERARYIADTGEFGESAALFAPAAEARTHSARDVPLAPGNTRFPVLTFSHGYGWPRFTSSFVTEWIASHGYVVVGINHTGSNPTARFPDGYHFQVDANGPPLPSGDGVQDARAFWDFLTEHQVSTWRDDISFVLDNMERLDAQPGPFTGRLDLGRVGAFGWSFGGAMSLDVTRLDRRVRAAVDLDGQLFGSMIEEGTDRPVMLIHSTLLPPDQRGEISQAAFDSLVAEVEHNYATFLDRSRGDWYDLRIAGALHGSFSDIVFFTEQRQPGEIDPHRAHEIIQAYTLAFFDRYLRGAASELLDGPAASYSEVEFRRRSR